MLVCTWWPFFSTLLGEDSKTPSRADGLLVGGGDEAVVGLGLGPIRRRSSRIRIRGTNVFML